MRYIVPASGPPAGFSWRAPRSANPQPGSMLGAGAPARGLQVGGVRGLTRVRASFTGGAGVGPKALIGVFGAGITIGLGVGVFVSEGLRGPNHPALQYGAPTAEEVRVYKGYVAALDTRNRNPSWVLEKITKGSLQGPGDRKESKFAEDKEVDKRFRSTLSDYRGSGYDRGHMAPAGDHKGSQRELDETFQLTNISPQQGQGFNRDYWARLEQFVRDVAQKSDAVYVVTGPLYLPTPTPSGGWAMSNPVIGTPKRAMGGKVMGGLDLVEMRLSLGLPPPSAPTRTHPQPKMVSVPTHFYKVILAEGKDRGGGGQQRAAVGAFVVPNAPIPPGEPLSRFIVRLYDLECAAGLKFFDKYLTEEKRDALDVIAPSFRTAPLPYNVKLIEGGGGGGGTALASATGVDSRALAKAEKVLASGGGLTGAHLCSQVACELPGGRY